MISEIRLSRDLTPDELALGEGIAATLVRRIPDTTEYDYFDGLVSTIGVLTALGAPGSELAVARLLDLATPDGWQPSWLDPDRTLPDGRCNDVTLGTASVLLGAVWAMRHAVPRAVELAERASTVLVNERVETSAGLDWDFIPARFQRERRGQMPNWSHGLAGIAGSLAAAGIGLGRPDLVDAARLGAEHLVTLADTGDGGMRLPHVIPDQDGLDTYTYTWCHGPAGTSLLFAALDRAGAAGVAGRSAYDWERACLHSLRESGIPERRYPGFWDNDGRCCGTAGVGDVVLNVWQRHGHDDDLAFAVTLADAVVDRAIHDRRRPGLLALRRAPQRRPAAAARRGLDARRSRHRGVPLPRRARARPGPRRRRGRADGHLVGTAHQVAISRSARSLQRQTTPAQSCCALLLSGNDSRGRPSTALACDPCGPQHGSGRGVMTRPHRG